MNKRLGFFNLALSVSGVLAAAHMNAAFAQQAQAATDAAAVAPEEVVVTGTRIATQAGYEAPTPLTVMNAEMFEQSANSALQETLRQIPAFSGGFNITTGTGVPSFNQAGLSTVELRNLRRGSPAPSRKSVQPRASCCAAPTTSVCASGACRGSRFAG